MENANASELHCITILFSFIVISSVRGWYVSFYWTGCQSNFHQDPYHTQCIDQYKIIVATSHRMWNYRSSKKHCANNVCIYCDLLIKLLTFFPTLFAFSTFINLLTIWKEVEKKCERKRMGNILELNFGHLAANLIWLMENQSH